MCTLNKIEMKRGGLKLKSEGTLIRNNHISEKNLKHFERNILLNFLWTNISNFCFTLYTLTKKHIINSDCNHCWSKLWNLIRNKDLRYKTSWRKIQKIMWYRKKLHLLTVFRESLFWFVLTLILPSQWFICQFIFNHLLFNHVWHLWGLKSLSRIWNNFGYLPWDSDRMLFYHLCINQLTTFMRKKRYIEGQDFIGLCPKLSLLLSFYTLSPVFSALSDLKQQCHQH